MTASTCSPASSRGGCTASSSSGESALTVIAAFSGLLFVSRSPTSRSESRWPRGMRSTVARRLLRQRPRATDHQHVRRDRLRAEASVLIAMLFTWPACRLSDPPSRGPRAASPPLRLLVRRFPSPARTVRAADAGTDFATDLAADRPADVAAQFLAQNCSAQGGFDYGALTPPAQDAAAPTSALRIQRRERVSGADDRAVHAAGRRGRPGDAGLAHHRALIERSAKRHSGTKCASRGVPECRFAGLMTPFRDCPSTPLRRPVDRRHPPPVSRRVRDGTIPRRVRPLAGAGRDLRRRPVDVPGAPVGAGAAGCPGGVCGGCSALVAELDWFEEQAARRGLDMTAAALPATLAYRVLLQRLDSVPFDAAVTALWAIERVYLLAWSSANSENTPFREFVEQLVHPGLRRLRRRAGRARVARCASGARRRRARARGGVLGYGALTCSPR